MDKYLRIASKGEMAIEGLTLIGASTKRGDGSQIGMFGSGLKYSIASLLKQEIPFHIFSGLKEFKITRASVAFGGSDFKQIYVNGEKTSFTDTMGNNDWDGAWPFTREIYSNALDAGGASITIVEQSEIEMIEDYTIFYIKVTDTVDVLVQNFENYFVTKSKHLYADNKNNYIHPASKTLRIYRKGILVHTTRYSSIFSYDLSNIEINESRTLKYSWTVKEKIGVLFETCTDAYIIRQFMHGISGGNTGMFEHNCILDKNARLNASKEYLQYIENNDFYPTELSSLLDASEMKDRVELPISLLRRFLRYVPSANILGVTVDRGQSGTIFVEKEKPSKSMIETINNAELILRGTSYGVRRTFPIKVCLFQDSSVLGCFDKETIWLSQKLETYPVDAVATIIIEEQEHGTSGHADLTRSFQNHNFKIMYLAFKETALLQSARNVAVQAQMELKNFKALPWYKKIGL